MLDVLKHYGSITLLTLEPLDTARIDDYYHTQLSSADIRPVIVRSRLLEFCLKAGIPCGLLKLHVLMRAAKQHLASGAQYDLVCSGYDEQDLGRPCIQYIHYPWNLYPRPDAPAGWNDNLALRNVILFYNALCRLYSGYSYQSMYQNLSLVNSRWTGEKSRTRYPGLSYLVVNPPALAKKIDDDGARRQEKFLSIGRCAREKEWLKLIDIVAGLRSRGHEVGLTLAGSRNTPAYEEKVRAKIAEAGPWAQLELDFSRERLQELLLTHRYGLHGMREEHYGMAVAELVLGGCLTSVPDDGGQVEIVTNPQLRYSSVDDAVEKWDRVLRDPALRDRLLQEQRNGRDHLSKERFSEQFDRLVRLSLERGVEGVVHALRQGDFSDLGMFSEAGRSKPI